MSENQGTPDLRAQPVRETAREARRRWAQEVIQALEEHRMSINAAAKEIGISPGRLQAWLSQDVEPSPRVMADLARVIGRSHLHLLQLLDWLPAQLGDAPLRLEASGKLHEAIADAQRWLHAAGDATDAEGGIAVARAVLASSSDWDVHVRNITRGNRHKTRYSTLLGFSRSRERRSAGAATDTAGDRQVISGLARGMIERTWSNWLAADDADAASSGFGRTDLILSSPVLTAARARGLRPDLRVPPSIAVLGIPWSGAQEVAALVAGMLDWAYLDLASAARELHGLQAEASAQIQMARRLLHEAGAAANLTVWSCDQAQPILKTIREIGEDLPLVVLLIAPDSTLEHTIRRLAVDGADAADELETAQNVARRTLSGQRDPGTYLLLDLPATDPAASADAQFDAHVEIALQVAGWLHTEHGGPRVSDAPADLSPAPGDFRDDCHDSLARQLGGTRSVSVTAGIAHATATTGARPSARCELL